MVTEFRIKVMAIFLLLIYQKHQDLLYLCMVSSTFKRLGTHKHIQ